MWIDRAALATGTAAGRMGLRAHLDAAVAQGAGSIVVVVDDLPGRDCDRAVPLGDFGIDGLSRHQGEFIDQIVAVEQDERYRSLRIVNVVEPRWLTLLAQVDFSPDASTAACRTVARTGSYVQGVRYAVERLHRAGPNVYTYLDAGNYHTLGWDRSWAQVFPDAVGRITSTVAATADGFASLDGVATNVAGYAPLTEPYFTVDDLRNGTPIHQSRWVDWNNHVDELPYATKLRAALVAAGFDPGLGVVVDTSRNGWGGPQRPTRTSAATNVNTYVDESRTDRRAAIGNWCNQVGAGLGQRPVPAPAPGIDAYAWVKLPGVSDDTSNLVEGEPLCDPTWRSGEGYHPTGAMPGAPAQGVWFPAALTQLMANAYPQLP